MKPDVEKLAALTDELADRLNAMERLENEKHNLERRLKEVSESIEEMYHPCRGVDLAKAMIEANLKAFTHGSRVVVLVHSSKVLLVEGLKELG